MKRPRTQAHPIHQETPDQPEHNLGPFRPRCTVNTPKTRTASRCNPSGRHRRADQCSRQAQRRGGENRKRGAGGDAGVKPRCLPGSESHRRIPASCPFPRNPCRQLRATLVSLAASDYRSKASSCLHHPRLQPGGGAEFYATVPTGLADSREPTFGLLPDWWKRPMQGSHGRFDWQAPCPPFNLK
jgi:hypothetical protein